MARWKNMGAAFKRSTGETVERGGRFTADADDPDVVRRAMKLREVTPIQVTRTSPKGAAASAEGGEDAPQEQPAEDVAAPEGERAFEGVDFASDKAFELANANLTAADFEGREGTGTAGAFKKSDVEALLAEAEG